MKPLKTFLVCATLSASSFGHSQVLYNINFENANQALDQTVKTGPAPAYISSIIFGNPKVTSSFSALTHQPLRFDTVGQQFPINGYYWYTQIQLDVMYNPTPTLDLAFDFADSGAQHQFGILFDTQTTFRRFDFTGGAISFQENFGSAVTFGYYALDQACHFDIHLNAALDQWTFYENGIFLGQGAYFPDSDIRTIRFNFAAVGPSISGTAIDNLVVAVPEPANLMILACVLILRRFAAPRRLSQREPHLTFDQSTPDREAECSREM